MEWQIDLHIHSSWSGDAYHSIPEMCAAAVQAGLTQIAFTDHVDHNPKDVSFGRFEYPRILREIEEARQEFDSKLSILVGAELAEPHLYPEEIAALFSIANFDVVLGSVHWVGGELVSAPNFNASRVLELYHDYFDSLLKMVETADIDVLAHFDIVERYGVKYLGHFKIEPFRETIEAILRKIIERGIALEVNTSGLRQPCREMFPSAEILALYREMGGRMVTIGSDAHKVEHVGFGLQKAVKVLRDLGFEGITTFSRREPQLVPWRAYGLPVGAKPERT